MKTAVDARGKTLRVGSIVHKVGARHAVRVIKKIDPNSPNGVIVHRRVQDGMQFIKE